MKDLLEAIAALVIAIGGFLMLSIVFAGGNTAEALEAGFKLFIPFLLVGAAILAVIGR